MWKKRDNIISAILFMMEPISTHSFQVLLGPGSSASCLALLLWRKASWRLLVMMCEQHLLQARVRCAYASCLRRGSSCHP